MCKEGDGRRDVVCPCCTLNFEPAACFVAERMCVGLLLMVFRPVGGEWESNAMTEGSRHGSKW